MRKSIHSEFLIQKWGIWSQPPPAPEQLRLHHNHSYFCSNMWATIPLTTVSQKTCQSGLYIQRLSRSLAQISSTEIFSSCEVICFSFQPFSSLQLYFLNYVLSLKEDEGHLEHQEKSSRKALCGVIKSLKVKNDVFYGKKHILVQFFGNKWLSNTCIYTAHTCIGRAVHVCPRACPNSPSFKANVISSMLPSLLIHLDCLSFSSLCPQNPKSFPVLCFCLQHWSILQLALYLIRK